MYHPYKLKCFEKLKAYFCIHNFIFHWKSLLRLNIQWNTPSLTHFWSFLTSEQKPTPQSGYRTFFHPKKFFLCQQSVNGPRSNPLIWYLLLWKGLHTNGINQCILFSVWLFLLSLIFYRFIQFVPCIGNLLQA